MPDRAAMLTQASLWLQRMSELTNLLTSVTEETELARIRQEAKELSEKWEKLMQELAKASRPPRGG
jgi:hypothetical protein